MNKRFLEITKHKNFISDVFLNTLASFIVTGIMQLLVYPSLASKLGAEDYGYFLTSIGISNIFAITLGNSLNNARLLNEDKYAKDGLSGDYNVFVLVSGIIIILLFPLFLLGVKNDNASSVILTTIVTILCFLRSYYSVGYRIRINYKRLLIQSFFYCIGGAIGIFLLEFLNSNRWQVPFIFAEGLAFLYILNSNAFLFAEPYSITKLVRSSLKKYSILILTSLIGNILTYLDRLLLLPLMGATMVSTYTVSSFFGKTIGVIVGPIAGVLLTYYAKMKTITKSQFKKQISAVLIVSCVMYVLSLFISKSITGLLYPSLIEDAKPYLWIANLSSILLCACNVIQPSVLRFSKVEFQPIIQLVHVLIYLILGIIMVRAHGLLGFCCAVMISNTIKMLLMIIIGLRSIGKDNEKSF